MWGLARQLRMGEKPERANSIGDRDNDHAFVREAVAPVQGHRGRSVDVPTAVNPDDHRKVLVPGLRWRPDIEIKTILTHCRRCLTRHGHTNLHTGRGKCIRLTSPGPGCEMSWRPPTQAPDRRSSEWDAF